MEAVSQQVITKIMTTFQDKAKENRRPRKKKHHPSGCDTHKVF
jgi:hypothetical protein